MLVFLIRFLINICPCSIHWELSQQTDLDVRLYREHLHCTGPTDVCDVMTKAHDMMVETICS